MNKQELQVTLFLLSITVIGYLLLNGYWVAVVVIAVILLVRDYRQNRKQQQQDYNDWWKRHNENK